MPSTIQASLDAYSAGRFEEVDAYLRAAIDSTEHAAAFRRDFSRTPLSASRRAIASFALEAAGQAFVVDGTEAAQILEIGCHVARSGPPDDWELEWHLAALALLEGPPSGTTADWPRGRLLQGAQNGGRFGLIDQSQHARDRFPQNSAIAFAQGLAQEQVIYQWVRSRRVAAAAPGHAPMHGVDATATEAATKAVPAFRVAATSGSLELSRSAKVHLGAVFDDLGDVKAAVPLWVEVANSGTDDETYLADLFLGRVLMSSNQLPEAERVLRSALGIARGQSANTLLSTVLYLTDRRAEAAELLNAAVWRSAERDPWITYLRGDFASWRERLEHLRGRLR